MQIALEAVKTIKLVSGRTYRVQKQIDLCKLVKNQLSLHHEHSLCIENTIAQAQIRMGLCECLLQRVCEFIR
jgi:hypothetical protein